MRDDHREEQGPGRGRRRRNPGFPGFGAFPGFGGQAGPDRFGGGYRGSGRGPGGPGGPGRGGRGRGPFGEGGPGFGSGFGPGFDPGFGPFGGRGRGRRPRGDVRAAVLVLLAEGPSNGYRIISEVEARSNGAWKPSPGSVYPTLQQLQDEGLVKADPSDAKQFTLTEEGRRHVAEHHSGPAPWESPEFQGEDGDAHEVARQVKQIMMTMQQIRMAGRPGDVRRVGDALERCRQELTAILSEDLRSGRGE